MAWPGKSPSQTRLGCLGDLPRGQKLQMFFHGEGQVLNSNLEFDGVGFTLYLEVINKSLDFF